LEWGGPCLWADNDPASDAFGIGSIDLRKLPLSEATVQLAKQTIAWHDQALNWDYPPDPGPWRQAECDRFNQASRQLFDRIYQELGPMYEVCYQQPDLVEDPDLDVYLRDPGNFRRDR